MSESDHFLLADPPRPVAIRDAAPRDTEGLMACKSSRWTHGQRLELAGEGRLRYLVAVDAGDVIGFCLLVFRRPPGWPANDANRDHLPRLIDLFVRPDRRRQGVATVLVRHVEGLARAGGASHLYLSVAADGSPAAHALYRKLGYRYVPGCRYDIRQPRRDRRGRRYWQRETLREMVTRLATAGVPPAPRRSP